MRERYLFTRRKVLGATAIAGAASFTRPAISMAQDPSLPKHVIYYGKDKPPDEFIELRAGPLTALFDPSLALLRYVSYGEQTVLLGLYSAVRNQNWGTVAPQVRDFKMQQSDGGFRLTFDVLCAENNIDFLWKGEVSGTPDGAIRFSMDGEARSDFLRNRIGFCVLHGADLAGKECSVRKVDGTVEKGQFPDLIAPHQPFFDVRSITHEVEPGVSAEILMEGDTFEMEDQRNWTDASYKTYCTPLAKPFPAPVNSGDHIKQSVTIKLTGASKAPAVVSKSAEVTVSLSGSGQPMPRLGIGLSNAAPLMNETEKARLRAVGPAHLRVELDLADPDWKDFLQRAVTEESRALKAPLEVAAFVTDDADTQLKALAAAAKQQRATVVRWLIYHQDEQATADKWVEIARKHLDGAVGGGANANFTELNRNRPSAPADVVCYSTNPQVHAFDNLSLVETFAGLPETVRTARTFTGDAKLAVAPITLKQRFNPVATAAAKPDSNKLPSPVDPRQMSLFGAGWTLGSIQALAHAGADSLTYYETLGWQGLMETKTGSRLPGKFRSIPGAVFPLYHVLADLIQDAGRELLPVTVSDPLKVAALASWNDEAKQKGGRLFLANLTSEVQYVRIEPNETMIPRLGVWTIDEHSAVEAMTDPEAFRKEAGRTIVDPAPIEVALLPYAYVKLLPI